MYFKDRQDAGRKLAEKLTDLKGKNAAILALPRGWVPVAYEVAKILQLPLDTLVVRKLGVISNPEFAFGAIADGDVSVVDYSIVRMAFMNAKQVDEIILSEKEELLRRKNIYKSGSYLWNQLFDQIILIDDGLATGMTMQAAIEATEKIYHPKQIIVAVPVAASDSVGLIKRNIHRFITLYQSAVFGTVGQYYRNFWQTPDEEVINLIQSQ